MAKKNSFKDIDRGYKKLLRVVRDLEKGPIVDVGVIGQKSRLKGEDGEATVVDYATYNEFGTPTIPERSFIRSTIDERERRIVNFMYKLQGELFLGKVSIRNALARVGQLVQSNIQNKIERLRKPPNEPSTIRQKKGATNPLIDEGRLRQSISYEVKENG